MASSYYAMCETGHFLWTGDRRADQETAQADATAHDNSQHSGVRTAVVMPSDSPPGP